MSPRGNIFLGRFGGMLRQTLCHFKTIKLTHILKKYLSKYQNRSPVLRLRHRDYKNRYGMISILKIGLHHHTKIPISSSKNSAGKKPRKRRHRSDREIPSHPQHPWVLLLVNSYSPTTNLSCFYKACGMYYSSFLQGY